MNKINFMGDGNKVAQPDWKNKIDVNSLDSEFVSKMTSCGYKPEHIIAVEETDIGLMCLLSDGLLTDFKCKFIHEVPLREKEFHRAVNHCLLLDYFYGFQHTSYDQLEKELIKLM